MAGTAITFFPILRKRDESIALGYVGFRLLEAALIVLGLVSILTLLTLRQEFEVGAALDVLSLQTTDELLRSIHAQCVRITVTKYSCNPAEKRLLFCACWKRFV